MDVNSETFTTRPNIPAPLMNTCVFNFTPASGKGTTNTEIHTTACSHMDVTLIWPLATFPELDLF